MPNVFVEISQFGIQRKSCISSTVVQICLPSTQAIMRAYPESKSVKSRDTSVQAAFAHPTPTDDQYSGKIQTRVRKEVHYLFN
jgi:hypothetical protein